MIKKILINIFTLISNLINRLISKLSNSEKVTITDIKYDKVGRFLVFYLENNYLKPHKQILRSNL